MSGRFWAVAAPLMWLAGALQESLAPRMAVAGVPPDFPLVALCCLALLSERRAGTALGFAAGLVRGAFAGANLAAYAVSRTLLGFGLGWVRFAGLVPNALVAGLAALAGAVATGLMVMLVSHHGPIIPYLEGTLVSAMIDAALAMPLYALSRRLILPANDR